MIPSQVKWTRVSISLAFANVVLVASILAGCQSGVIPDEQNPRVVTAQLVLDSAWMAPDQVTWRTTGADQAATWRDSSQVIVATIALPAALDNGASVWVGTWTAGMRSTQTVFTQQAGESQLKAGATVVDSVARALLALVPGSLQRHPDTLRKVYAKALVDGNVLFKGYPKNCPTGMDSLKLLDVALVYAVSKQTKLADLAAVWLLAIDTLAVHSRVKGLVESHQLQAADTLTFFPAPAGGVDRTGPAVVWLDPVADREVESSVVSWVVRFRLSDPSRIDTVLINGQKPDSVFAGGVYAKVVALGAPGTATEILIRAVDSVGNPTKVRRTLTRKAATGLEIYGLPDSLVMEEDSSRSLPLSANCPVGAGCVLSVASLDSGLLDAELVGAVGSQTLRVVPHPDRSGRGTVVVELTSGARKVALTLAVAVQPLNDAPVLVVSPERVVQPTGPVVLEGWKRSVVPGPADESGQKLHYVVTVDSGAALLRGDVVVDAQGRLTLTPKGVSGMVRLTLVAVDDGDSTGLSRNRSNPQTLRVRLDAPPTLRVSDTLVGFEDRRTIADTVRFEDAESSADQLVLDWVSLDSALLPRVNLRVKSCANGFTYDALTTQDQSGNARIAWILTDAAGNSVRDTIVIRFLPVNDAPVIGRASGLADTLVIPCTTSDTTLPKLFGGIVWEPGNRKDTGTISIRLADTSQSRLFYYGLLAQSNGGVRLLFSGDSAVTIQLLIVATDAGGVENGGQNISTRSIWIRMTNRTKDVDGNEYTYRRMPDGNFWMEQNLKVKPKNGDGTDTCGGHLFFRQRTSCEEFGRLYTWLQAMDVDASCASEACLTNVKDGYQGLCPDGWRIATTRDWSNLFQRTMDPGSTDSSYNLRSTDTSWQYYASAFPTRYSGSGKFGDFLEPVSPPNTGIPYSAGGLNVWRPEWGGAMAPDSRIDANPQTVIYMGTEQWNYGRSRGLASVRCVR